MTGWKFLKARSSAKLDLPTALTTGQNPTTLAEGSAPTTLPKPTPTGMLIPPFIRQFPKLMMISQLLFFAFKVDFDDPNLFPFTSPFPFASHQPPWTSPFTSLLSPSRSPQTSISPALRKIPRAVPPPSSLSLQCTFRITSLIAQCRRTGGVKVGVDFTCLLALLSGVSMGLRLGFNCSVEDLEVVCPLPLSPSNGVDCYWFHEVACTWP